MMPLDGSRSGFGDGGGITGAALKERRMEMMKEMVMDEEEWKDIGSKGRGGGS